MRTRRSAERLREHGLEVDVEAAADVDDLDGYEGVVLGGSIYMGRWHRDANRFLRRHREALAESPVAVFAMGPLTTSAEDVASSRKQLDHALAKAPDVRPMSVAVFGGVVDPGKLHFPFSHMPATDTRTGRRSQRGPTSSRPCSR